MKCSVDAVALKRSQIACDSRGESLCLTGMAVEGVKNVLPRAMVGAGDFCKGFGDFLLLAVLLPKF